MITTIYNAHRDDIHGLVGVREDQFISGSKDGTVKLWSIGGKLVKLLQEDNIDYKKWVTSIAVSYNSKKYISGHRNGYVQISKIDENCKERYWKMSSDAIVNCKERNENRITALTTIENNNFYVGMRGGFFLMNGKNYKTILTTKTSERDWVYCILPISFNSIGVVTGTELEILQDARPKRSGWEKTAIIISEKFNNKSNQRPFISDIKMIGGNNHIVASLFDSTSRVIDLVKKEEIFRTSEHSGRVWQVLPIDKSSYFTCADDGTIKSFDIRVNKNSLKTLDNHPGRVSSLHHNSHVLVAGSCPDKPNDKNGAGQLFFYDMRKI